MSNRLPRPTAGREALARRQFGVAWIFLLVTAASGVLLRLAGIGAVGWPPYGNLLHTHSHIAFLGWVFNAFFALATRIWVPEQRLIAFDRLFWVLQVANVGMLLSFPLQGYGAASIAFSTLHVGGSVAFAAMLWRVETIAPEALRWLRLALVFMLLSGLGPLVLAPLAAMNLRDAPAYALAIYWYLHFQYNGWFVTFLIAAGYRMTGPPLAGQRLAGRVVPVFATGVVLTYLVSALWLQPSPWIYGLGALGALLQLAVVAPMIQTGLRRIRKAGPVLGRVPRLLLAVALGALLAKCLLQLAAGWPPLHDVVHHRYTVIAFLHLVFLLVVLPALFAAAWNWGWIPGDGRQKAGLGILAAGVVGGEILLLWPVIGPLFALPLPISLPFLLLTAAILDLLGLGLLSPRPSRKSLTAADPRRHSAD